jgi:hypothetical protein
MARVGRVAAHLVVALAVAVPPAGLCGDDPVAGQQVEESGDDADDGVADWILRLFRGAGDDVRKPAPGPQGGKGEGGGSPPGSGGGRHGGDDGGDDGGDNGGDDGGDD